MWKFTLLAAVALTANAQTSDNPFAKAPPNLEDQLRARITEFYQCYVDGKFRKAEQLVAEESKDDFYAAGKPDIRSFRIGDIVYSDNFTKAKVTIVAKMLLANLVLGMGDPTQLVDVPFPSHWKLENDKWCWYINNDPKRMTPFGPINGEATAKGAHSAPPVPDFATIAKQAENGVKADRASVTLPKTAGAEEKVTFMNGLPGSAKLSLDLSPDAGFEAHFDRTDLKAGDKAVLTLRTRPDARYSQKIVRVLVQPTNQAIDISVTF